MRSAPIIRSSLRRTATALAVIALILQGCAIAPPAAQNPDWSALQDKLQQLKSWQLRGRVNIRYEGESYTPRLRWQQASSDYEIRLWGTFNAGNTLIKGNPDGVSLETDGRTSNARTPERLILNELGYEFPVSSLVYWIKGQPAPAPRPQISFDELNQLEEIQQDGWTIRYPDPRQYGELSLPRRIEVSRSEQDIRLVFVGLSWTLTESSGLN